MSTNQGTLRSKLLKLKEWVTVPEAAKFLSMMFNEEVVESDILRLALDGHLKLSANFVNKVSARFGNVVSFEDVELVEINLLGLKESCKLLGINESHNSLVCIPEEIKGDRDKIKKFLDQLPREIVIRSLYLGDDRFLNFDKKVRFISGVWDLTMIGEERYDVERRFQILTGGPEVKHFSMKGAVVENEDGVIYQIQEFSDSHKHIPGSTAQLEKLKEYIANNNVDEEIAKEILTKHKENRKKFLDEMKKKKHYENFVPANLPSDSVLVVRTNALLDLQEKLSSKDSLKEKPLGTTERENLLITIIDGLVKSENAI